MNKFYYWFNRAKAIKVGDEQTVRAYQYLMQKAIDCLCLKNTEAP